MKTAYKCAQADCKYTSDKQGECCSRPLEKSDGTMYKCAQADCKYTSDKQGDCCSKPLEKASAGCGSNCDCC